MTIEQLQRVCPKGKPELMQGFVASLNEEGRHYGLTSLLAIQHFVAQCAHESNGFQTFEEYASGKAYEGSKRLGNTLKGDGPRFKGRGAIQLTGRYNYAQLSKDVGIDYVAHPEWLSGPINGTRAAMWYWKRHNLTPMADDDNFLGITMVINGGANGLDSRQTYLTRAKQYIVAPEPEKPLIPDLPEPHEDAPDYPKTREDTWVAKAVAWWRNRNSTSKEITS